jgi:hypothetical protein
MNKFGMYRKIPTSVPAGADDPDGAEAEAYLRTNDYAVCTPVNEDTADVAPPAPSAPSAPPRAALTPKDIEGMASAAAANAPEPVKRTKPRTSASLATFLDMEKKHRRLSAAIDDKYKKE